MVCVLAFVGAMYLEQSENILDEEGKIERENFGEGKTEVNLLLNADSYLKDYQYDLSIEEVHVTDEMAKELFTQAKQEIDKTFLMEGQNPNHVTEAVFMKDSYVNKQVASEWYFDSYRFVDTEGNVIDDALDASGQLVQAEAHLSVEGYEELYTFSFMVFPKELTQTEQLLHDLNNYFTQQQEMKGEKYIYLPSQINGQNLTWQMQHENLPLKVLLLEGIILVILPLAERSRRRDEEKKRQKALLLDYPEMVSKINVLVGAGMTIKQAWHIISAQYLDKRKKNTIKESIAFEEMVKADREIRDGESERIAYQRFAERTQNPSYERFVRLLISNLLKGNRGLSDLLEQESEKAFSIRRMQARQLGEEAQTKLLLPMIMMLGIVMAIVIVPAMQGFTM